MMLDDGQIVDDEVADDDGEQVHVARGQGVWRSREVSREYKRASGRWKKKRVDEGAC